MAKTVRKVKRGKIKDAHINVPCVENPPAINDTKRQPPLDNKTVPNTAEPNPTQREAIMKLSKEHHLRQDMSFNVENIIAELSENSKASKTEIQIIQKRLIQQANDILKVNPIENVPKVVDATQKYSSFPQPIYGRVPANNCSNLKPLSASGSTSTSGHYNYNPPSTSTYTVPTQIKHENFVSSSRNPPSNANISGLFEANRNAVQQQIIPERLVEGNKIIGVSSVPGNMQRVDGLEAGNKSVFLRTGSYSAPTTAAAISTRGTSHQVTGGGPSPPYRMPPAPEAALPGAPAPSHPPALHTHSAKFPIEREVILSSGDKGSKVSILQEARKRGRLTAVAPDTPPKALSAWTHAENQQPGPSGDNNYRYHHDSTYGYSIQNQGATPRTQPGYEHAHKPPVPAKNTTNYSQKTETPNNLNNINTQSITITVETGKDSTKDAPKSSKSVSKTYHTLKDMIASRFKNKDNGESEKNNDNESLNNCDERTRSEEEVTPRENIRKVDQGIYGRPIPQNRAEVQYALPPPPHVQYANHNHSPHRQLMQQPMLQQQMTMSHQARSQEMLHSPHVPHARPMTLGADALYQQYGPPGRRNTLYQRDADARNMANFTSLKQTASQIQMESQSRADMRSPQQLEREIIRQKGLVVGRRAASQPLLLDEPQHRPEVISTQMYDRSRRNSHGNLLEGSVQGNGQAKQRSDERESDDGGFRSRPLPSRSNHEERIRTSGRSNESHRAEPIRVQDNIYRRTPDLNIKDARKTPDSINQKGKDDSGQMAERNDESASQKSVDSMYNSSKAEAYTQPMSLRVTPSRIEDLKSHGKKSVAGSGANSDNDKNGGQSSNVDSGRGSVAYSSGRRPDVNLHDTSADSDAVGSSLQPQPGTSHQTNGNKPDSEWADIVECELRQILEPKLAGMRIDSSGSSVTSVTPPLPPLSPSSDMHKPNSLPSRAPEYGEDRRRGRESPRWHGHKKHSSKRDHHYKKHLFGLDNTDMTSTTTRSLDLSSLLDGRTDSDASTGDARAIRRQLRGLENMYAEVLQLLGVRKPASLAKGPTWEARLSSKRRYGSMSSLPSSSVSSRPVRDKRRSSDHRKKHDAKGINKRFQRLESHVVTLARSVAHLSSEMRTQHLVMQEMDAIRAEIAALRHMYKSQQYHRSTHHHQSDPYSFSNPDRVKRLTKFFGDEPPLMRLFLKKLGYEKYAALLEKEQVGAAELPYVGEDKLRALGVPLGPRMRILKEAGIHSEIYLPRDDHHNTTTTLAIV